MFELRILNGLHRGATLPLDERPLIIGASEDADVVLVDPGMEAQHATLTPTADGWSLSALDGEVLGAEHNRPLASLDLQEGDFARLDHIWLTVTDTEAPWENPPPEPNDAAEAASQADDEQDDDEQDEYEPYSDSPLDATPDAQAAPSAPSEPAADAAAPAETPPVTVHAPTGRNGWRRSRIILGTFAIATILSACAAYTISSRSGDAPADATPDTRNASAPQIPQLPLPKAPAQAQRPELPKPEPRVSQAEPRMSQAELREAFHKRLKEVDLLKRFKLDLRDNAWTMHAALDEDEAARFERILSSFIKAHNIKFPVHVKIGGAEAMLPFRIREVVFGSNASVVTADGNRMYVGDEYRGVRLVAVEPNLLRFDGERKIKVKW